MALSRSWSVAGRARIQAFTFLLALKHSLFIAMTLKTTIWRTVALEHQLSSSQHLPTISTECGHACDGKRNM